MVDIGIAPGTTETSRLVVDEIDGSLAIIGAGVEGGPSRRVDIFEDVHVRGNLRGGELHGVRIRMEQGTDGVITQGGDDEVPRLDKLVGDSRLHIIGGGPLGGPDRSVVVHDDLRVEDDLVVANDVSVQNNLDVTGDVTVSTNVEIVGDLIANDITSVGSINVGLVGSWGKLHAENATIAAGTFHVYDRGPGPVGRLVCGFGWDSVNPILVAGPRLAPPPIGYQFVALLLEDIVSNPTVVITPWLVGMYDEMSLLTSPVLLAPTANPIMHFINPMQIIHGSPTGLGGALPAADFCVQQLDIAFFDAVANPFISTDDDGSAQPGDLVFDVAVTGARCVAP